MSDLTALIATESALVQEAALALPHSFDKCTHEKGPIRQAVHLCLTCGVPRGLCSACSISCHGNHEQIELFPKRAFVCDCPTTINGTSCMLHKGPVVGNDANTYGQNFDGRFCRCHRPYDAKRERETMIQCVCCEDWYHESCLNLRTRPSERPATPQGAVPNSDDHDGDGDSNASNDLPPPLLPSSAYDSFICGGCVLSNDVLRRWAGTKGVMMVYSNEGDESNIPTIVEDGGIDRRWKVLDGDESSLSSLDVGCDVEERKRGPNADFQDSSDMRPIKRSRTENGSENTAAACMPCLAPPLNPVAQSLLAAVSARLGHSTSSDDAPSGLVGEGDIFLTEGWRDRWCRCLKCLRSFERHSFLLEEEETYVPPEDPDSGMSLEDLGMRALLNLPRDRALDGIRAYNAMRDELISYLRPFAQEGRIVREEDVRGFFEAKEQEAKS